MTRDEFNDIVQEFLVQAWGQKNYSGPQLQLLGNVVRELPASELRQAIEAVSMTSTRAPSLAQIRAALSPSLARLASDRRKARLDELSKVRRCLECEHTGFITAHKPEAPLIEYSFICGSCDAASIIGLREGRGLHKWSSEKSQGFVARRFTVESETKYREAARAAMPAPRKREIVDIIEALT